MKEKISRIVVMVTLLLTLFGAAGGATADGPNPFEPFGLTTVTLDPSTVYPGETITIQIDFDLTHSGGNTENHFCFYLSDTDFASGIWEDSPVATGGDNYGTPDKDGDQNTACPNVTNFNTEVLYTKSSPAGNPFGGDDHIEIDFTVPSTGIDADSYTLGIRQYNDANADDTPDTMAAQTSENFTVQAASSNVYVANSGNCSDNSPCYTGGDALSDAVDSVASGGTVWVEGNYGQNELANFDNKTVTIRGSGTTPSIENAFGDCASTMIQKTGTGTLTFQDLTLDGKCSGQGGAGTGIDHNGGTLYVTNSTIRNFPTSGFGIDTAAGGTIYNNNSSFDNNGTAIRNTLGTLTLYQGTDGNTFNNNNVAVEIDDGSADIRYNTFDGNDVAVQVDGGDTVTIGDGPSSGNTIQNGAKGIDVNSTDPTLVIQGNTISGNSNLGMGLPDLTTEQAGDIYGNRVTGNTTGQINCNPSINGYGAAYNWVGTTDATTSDCVDYDDRLGANWSDWTEGTSLNQVTLGTSGVIFDLGDKTNPPFGVGVSGADGLDQLISNFYVIKTSGSAQFNPTASGRLYRIEDSTECTQSSAVACWDFQDTECGGGECTGDPITASAPAADGHYVVGTTNDPTAITLRSVSVAANSGFMPVVVLGLALVVSLGAVIVIRRKRS